MPAPTYQAEQAKDGNWTIFNVPIFSVHVDNRGEEPLVFSKGWLRKALNRAQTRQGEGYYPPLHIHHHGDGDVKPAGKFKITKIADHQHGGRPVPTLFADLVGVRPEVYERIRRGELSYRSVEILDVDEPELDSLALLDDEVPFFRYPLLKIGSEKSTKQLTPALAYKARGQSAALLFNYEDDMKDPTEYAQEQSAPAWAMDMLTALAKIADAVGASKQEEEEEEASEEAEVELKAVDIDIDADDDDEEEEPEEKAKRSAPLPKGGGSPVEVGMSQRAAMRAVTDTVKTLRDELDGLKADRRIERQASKLRATGIGEDRVKKFTATYREDGERAALVYARALEDMRPTEPPRQFSGELRYSEDPDPKCIASFAQQGPEALEKARSLHRSYQATQPEMPLDRYMEINMDPDGFFARARVNAGRGGE